MDVWTAESSSGKQTMLSVICAVTGLALVIGFRHFSGFPTNSLAGFFLGVLLMLIGAAGFLTSGKQVVVVDPRNRQINIQDSNSFRTKKRSIPFGEVVDIGIGYLGKKSNYVTWYYLVLKLRTGEVYPLFAPGRFFAGGSDRATVAGWKQRLESYLRQ